MRTNGSYLGFADASPFAFGLLALGFCALGLLLGFCVAAGLLLNPGWAGALTAAPFPFKVTRSLTRRFPAKELAMRRAVSFSLLVCTLPLSSMVLSVTLTFTLSLRSVGSFWRAS